MSEARIEELEGEIIRLKGLLDFANEQNKKFKESADMASKRVQIANAEKAKFALKIKSIEKKEKKIEAKLKKENESDKKLIELTRSIGAIITLLTDIRERY